MNSRLKRVKKSAKGKFSSLLPAGTRNGWSKHSLFPHLLQCNDPPSEAELEVIEDAIEKAQTELDFLQLQSRGTAPTNLSAIAKQKQECEDFIRIHIALISPLRRLPVDLLSEIFTQAAYSKRSGYSSPPWALSQVCREWRTVSLSLPFLWNCIDITFGDEKQKTHSFLQFLSMHIERSQSIPVDIFATSALDYVQHPIIDILIHHSKRWGSVHLKVPGHTLHAFSRVKDRLPVLHTLSLNLSSAGPFEHSTLLNMFETAPQLKCITICGTSTPIPIYLPWPQLISYRDDTSNHSAKDKVLSLSPSLEALYFAFNRTYIFCTMPIFPQAHLQQLRQFSITFKPALGRHDTPPASLLDGLTMPCVKDIRCINYCTDNAGPLKSLIKRSHISLTKLEFAPRLNLPSGVLSSILQLTPQLIDLGLLALQVQDLTCLILDPFKPLGCEFNEDLVPLLQNLVVHLPQTGLHAGSEEQIALIVASRCEVSGPGTTPMAFRLVFYRGINNFTLNYWSPAQESLEEACSPTPTVALEQDRLHQVVKYNALLSREIQLSLYDLFVKTKTPSPKTNSKAVQALSNRMMGLLSDIDKIQFDHVKELYMSGLHYLLHHVIQAIQESKHSQQEPFSVWKQHAEDILDKWNSSMILEDLPNRRWAFQGFHSLVYIPANHEIRQYPISALKIVYGMSFHGDKYYIGGRSTTLVPSGLEYYD